MVGVAVKLARALPADAVRLGEWECRARGPEETAATAAPLRAAGVEEVLARTEVEPEIALQTPATVLAGIAELAIAAGGLRELARRAAARAAVTANDGRAGCRNNPCGLLSRSNASDGKHAERGQNQITHGGYPSEVENRFRGG